MASNLVWPHNSLRPKDTQWSLSAAAYQGGRPFSGAAPQAVAFTGGPLWRTKLIDVALRTREQVNAWHALEGLLTGGVQTIVVPRCDRRHGPRPTVVGVPHDEDVPFDGDVLYDGLYDFSAVIVGAHALRSTTLHMEWAGGRPLTWGMHFSINHGGDIGWRLYRVVSVDGGEVGIRPPLRAAVPDGTTPNFELPRCKMRLTNPAGMELTLELLKYGSPSVEFVEAF